MKGKLFFDHLITASKVDARQQTADLQVPFVNKGIKVPYVSGVSVDTTQSNPFASKENPDPDTRTWKESQITYIDGLKQGDLVAVQKLDGNNMYVILARVVSAL